MNAISPAGSIGHFSRPPYSELSTESHSSGITVSCETRLSYPILFSEVRSALVNIVVAAAEGLGCTSSYIIADEHTMTLAAMAAEVVSDHSLEHLGMSILDGQEMGKSEESVTRLWGEMHGAGVMRRTLVVGIGCGVTCDVTGFVTSTYMRGLPYALVPATLMAQVDAAIGGKTGFNFAAQKNLIGSFHHPVGVVVDSDLLGTLPDRVFRNGLAEMIKVGVIGSPALFKLLANRDLDTLRRDTESVEVAIRTAIVEKLRLLQSDPLESRDLRRALNFGHCVGHAIEAESGYAWLHGECVAAGMAVACRVGIAAGVSDPEVVDQVLSILQRLELPQHVPGHLSDSVWKHLDKIARVRNGCLNLVVPNSLGKPLVLTDWPSGVSWDDVR